MPELRVVVSETKCCGLMELDHLGRETDLKKALEEIIKQILVIKSSMSFPAMILFTGVTKRTRADHSLYSGHVNWLKDYGQEFADFIKENRLGTVVKTKEVVNKLTDNGIKVWIWATNTERLAEITKELGLVKEKPHPWINGQTIKEIDNNALKEQKDRIFASRKAIVRGAIQSAYTFDIDIDRELGRPDGFIVRYPPPPVEPAKVE